MKKAVFLIIIAASFLLNANWAFAVVSDESVAMLQSASNSSGIFFQELSGYQNNTAGRYDAYMSAIKLQAWMENRGEYAVSREYKNKFAQAAKEYKDNIFDSIRNDPNAQRELNQRLTGALAGRTAEDVANINKNGSPVDCVIGYTGKDFNIGACLVLGAAYVSELGLYVSGWTLNLVEKLFQYTIDKTIVEFADFANQEYIKNVWKQVRNLANIFMFFILLYAAISLILKASDAESKRIVTSVIIAALLINFSFFLTGEVIRVSNIVTVALYKKAAHVGGQPAEYDITRRLVDTFITTPTKPTDAPAHVLTTKNVWGTLFDIIFSKMGQLLIFVITAVVLFAAMIALIKRFVILIFVLIFSPIPFISASVPKLKETGEMWVNALTKQAIFAPAYFFALWLAVEVVIGATLEKGGGLATLGANNISNSAIQAIIYALIINAFMIGALLVGNALGDKGSAGAVGMLKGWGNRAKGWGRQTSSGRLAYGVNKVLDKSKEKLESSWAGRLALRGGALLGGGVIKGAIEKEGGLHKDHLERKDKEIGAAMERRKGNPGAQADYLMSMWGKGGQTAYKSLPERDRVAVEDEIRKKLKGKGKTDDEIKDYIDAARKGVTGRMTEEEREKFEESRKKALEQQDTKERTAELKTALDDLATAPTDAAKIKVVKDVLGKMSNEQVAKLDDNLLKLAAPHLNGGQLNAVMDRKDLKPDARKAVTEARLAPLNAAIVAGNATVVAAELAKMGSKQVAKLGDTILTKDIVMNNLTIGDLKKIVDDDVNRGTRQIIRNHINRNPAMIDQATWLAAPVGMEF